MTIKKDQSDDDKHKSNKFKKNLKSLSNKFANEKKKNLLINAIKYQIKKDKIK